MKPPDTSGHDTKDQCWRVALAAALELPIDKVPPILMEVETWWVNTRAWLQTMGLDLLSWEPNSETDWWTPAGIVLVTGKSPRGDWNHTVVYDGGEMVFDPHDSNLGIVGRPTGIEAFQILDPALVTLQFQRRGR